MSRRARASHHTTLNFLSLFRWFLSPLLSLDPVFLSYTSQVTCTDCLPQCSLPWISCLLHSIDLCISLASARLFNAHSNKIMEFFVRAWLCAMTQLLPFALFISMILWFFFLLLELCWCRCRYCNCATAVFAWVYRRTFFCSSRMISGVLFESHAISSAQFDSNAIAAECSVVEFKILCLARTLFLPFFFQLGHKHDASQTTKTKENQWCIEEKKRAT